VTGEKVNRAAKPVTVTVARAVAPGREQDFEDWAERLTTAASRFTGFLGAGLLRPGAVGEPWHVVYRFDTPAHLAAWERSSARQERLAAGEELMRTTGTHKVSGLETWFAVPGRTAPAPPRWKMFLVSLAGIYALQLVLYVVFGGATTGWPLPLRLGLFVPLVTALMTWVVMPRLAVALQSWLYAPRRRR
jgi:antibiotic biosynthesis monooxygenase (ABM) superfamily enzyme